jgi:two-component system, NtrC family, sensor histidine kinase HydH
MTRKTILASLLFLIFLSSLVFIMAYRANQELSQMVAGQYNDQQLSLARKIAQDIESHFAFLETALVTYSRHALEGDPGEQSRHHFQILKDWQILGLGILYENSRDSALISSPFLESLDELGLEIPRKKLLELISLHEQGSFFYSQTIKPAAGPFDDSRVILMATPGRYAPGSEIPQDALNDPPLTFFVVDAYEVARRYAHRVVSGKTGYPWVIDDQGFFIYHVEEDFLGQNSLTIRQEKNPAISYQRINDLTRQRLLQGEEGTDWYISGWHRDLITEMKKLVAFSPANFPPGTSGDSRQNVWSVGLAVPETEVYGLIQPMVLRQWAVTGLFIIIIFSGLLILYLISLRWNRVLSQKVDEKTRHLVRSQDLLRKEKEKVELSLQALVEAQQKLVHAERLAAIGEAASHLSHEIKNPLMLMAGFARQVARSLPENDPNQEKLGIISEEAKRLENMLIQVRDFTRPQQLRQEKAQINDLILETTKLVQEKLDMDKIRVSLNLFPELPEAYFDQAQIKQVLLNLIKNAWEAIPGEGSISITTGVEKNRIMVSIEDTGTGIPGDKLEEIFNPFFTTKDKGTGLGLAVIQRIVQDHQGDIRVDSEPGRGSRFIFYLPL